MAEKIELQIVADNADYINKTKEVAQATVTMQRSVQEGEKRQKGLIEDTTEAIKKYEKARKQAYKFEDLEKYNKKIAEAKQTLKEYEQAGLKVDEAQKKQVKSTNNLWSSIKKLGAAYLSINAAVKIFKAVMDSTQGTGDLLRREMSGLKTMLDELSRTIATGNWAQLGERLKQARLAGMQYADAMDAVGDRERELLLIETERQGKMIELAKIYRNTGLVGAEGYRKRKEAAEEYIRLAEEGERDALEVLQLRLDAELDFARQKLGYSQDISDAEKKRVNEEIINNVRSAKAFDQNKESMQEYQRLIKELAEAEQGVPVRELIGEVWIETSRKIDTTKVDKLKASIAAIPPEVRNMSETFEEWGNITDPIRDRVVAAYDAIGKKQNEVANSTIRANTMMELSNTMLAKEEEKTLGEREKALEKFIEETAKLRDQYEQDQIEQLTGIERIRAEQEFELRQVQLLEDHLSELGTLTEEHYKYLDGLRASANLRAERAIRVEQQTELDYWNDFYGEAIAERMKFYDFREELDIKTAELAGELTERKELEIQKKWLQARLDLLKASKDPELLARAEILDAEIGLIQQKIDGIDASETIWTKLGFNDEQKEALQGAVNDTVDALDQIFDARVQDAERTRELLDTQISETQRALEAEMELMKAGYASNVDAKRKELEELQKQREKALKQEEAAIKAKRQLETVTQTVSLISAAAETFKAFPGPLLPIAIATVAAMFAAFATAKIKAAAAAKLAEGGTGTKTGMITGRSHAQGGERFLDHVEVERGEMWGVLSKKATAKYGKQFNQIVTSFNKDQIPVAQMADVHNNILIDVSQTNERLDRVQGELIKLNRHFGVSAEVFETPTARIIKRGNKTRIIRK